MTFAKYLFAVLLISVVSHLTFAQQLSHPVMASRHDAIPAPHVFRTMADTIDVLAVMVQFQVDNDTRTDGNGQFDLTNPATTAFDSPPHNNQYFLDHLKFLSGYFRKVSKGKTFIRTTLVDSIYSLSGMMQTYSPPKAGPNTLVGNLARDTWQKVDSSGRVPDFSRYQAFVVFHAGVGRDVDVTGTLGYDPAPLDIPSLYLGLNAFRQFYGAQYEGIPVHGGFKITNTIVMPETETRELPASPSNFVLRLAINGLLCASVGNYLGLPDLFDTNTGRSGIGRFGLMDGQAIFSFAGTFPPEPSAWEKYWLGWIQPVTVHSGTTVLSLPAVSLEDSVYRIPISASEYFLVENRNRDAGRNGQRITTSYHGVISQQTFARDTTGFDGFDLSAIKGNVIDVEDLDWSLPGGVGTNNVFYDGGTLIWHIDETVIAEGLATNGVNGNPSRRGVNLEEADGSQDIGQQYGQLEPGSGSEEGTAIDFWYQGNESPVNHNEFSATSHPGSASNSGANSHIMLKDFSQRSPHMIVTAVVGDEVVLLPGFPKTVPNKIESTSLTAANLGGAAGQSILITTGPEVSGKPRLRTTTADLSRIYAWSINGNGNGVLRPDGVLASVETQGSSFLNAVAVKDLNGDGVGEVVIGEDLQGIVTSHLVRAYSVTPGAVDSQAVPFFSRSVNQQISTSPTITDSAIALGGAHGRLYVLSRSGVITDSLTAGDTSGIEGIVQAPGSVLGFYFTTVSGNVGTNLALPAFAHLPATASIAGPPVIGILGNNQTAMVFATRSGSLYAYDIGRGFTLLQGFPVNTGSAITNPPALADVDGDGIRDIVVFGGSKVYAYNYAGNALDNFPKLILSSKPITSNPIVADVDGDSDADIVAVTGDGMVVAFDKNGTMARGFPLQAGTGNQSVAAFPIPTAQLSVTDIGLAVASSDDGSVTAWKTGSISGNAAPRLPWPQYQHDAQHTGFSIEQISGTPISSSFFPKERAYNWPNPVYNGRTSIRYYVSEAATVKIKVYDLAGDLVKEFSGPGIAGVDNEVEWNVGDVQSGVYLARIEANGAGKTEVAIVKVAVVK